MDEIRYFGKQHLDRYEVNVYCDGKWICRAETPINDGICTRAIMMMTERAAIENATLNNAATSTRD